MNNKSNALSKLIKKIQRDVKNGKMTVDTVKKATNELSELGYKYNTDTFPELTNTELFTDSSTDTPNNLAEALLWKLGKWKSYKKFTKQFTEEILNPTNTDVVFYAFAKHLRNQENPIYDQHALRALWAISDKFTDEDIKKCKNVLFDTKQKWKSAGSGGYATDCYNIFITQLNAVVKDGASKKDIDQLLMPLGQAIKKQTDNFKQFSEICGWR